MKHVCTQRTDLDELIGGEEAVGGGLDCRYEFRYGPLAEAMRRDEVLVLENSASLSLPMRAKIRMLLNRLFIAETEEVIQPGRGFRLIMA